VAYARYSSTPPNFVPSALTLTPSIGCCASASGAAAPNQQEINATRRIDGRIGGLRSRQDGPRRHAVGRIGRDSLARAGGIVGVDETRSIRSLGGPDPRLHRPSAVEESAMAKSDSRRAIERPRRRAPTVPLLGAALLALANEARAQLPRTSRVSLDSSGGQANAGCGEQMLSADGRFVVFNTVASNLVSGDANLAMDVFVHDRITQVTECESVDPTG